MIRLLTLLYILILATVLDAAPIPKSLKARGVSGDPNGVWQLTRFNINGKDGGHENMSKYWEIDGELFFIGIANPDNRGQQTGTSFKITDTEDPNFRIFQTSPSRIKVDGDRLCWVYTSGAKNVVDECEPGPNRYYYEYKRVK